MCKEDKFPLTLNISLQQRLFQQNNKKTIILYLYHTLHVSAYTDHLQGGG